MSKLSMSKLSMSRLSMSKLTGTFFTASVSSPYLSPCLESLTGRNLDVFVRYSLPSPKLLWVTIFYHITRKEAKTEAKLKKLSGENSVFVTWEQARFP